jgi:hypothetical protein
MLTVSVLLQMGFVSATYMRCNTSGKEKVYLTEKSGCCPVFPLEENSIDLKCCDYEQYATVFHSFKSEHKTLEFTQLQPALPVQSGLSANAVAQTASKIYWKHQKAPPLYGSDYLHLICKYNI